MAAQPLGGRMKHDVGAQLHRPAEVGRGEGGVHHERQAGPVGDLGQGRHVQHLQPGVAQDLGVDQTGVGLDRRLEALHVARVHQGGGDAETRQGVGEEVDAAAVERARRDDVVALTHERDDSQMERRVARGRGDRAHPHLQGRDALLQDRHRGVGDPAVDVPGPLQVEQGRGMVGVPEHIGCGLIDRHRPGAGHRIRTLAGVERLGIEAQELGIGHGWASLQDGGGRRGPTPEGASLYEKPAPAQRPSLGRSKSTGAAKVRPKSLEGRATPLGRPRPSALSCRPPANLRLAP